LLLFAFILVSTTKNIFIYSKREKKPNQIFVNLIYLFYVVSKKSWKFKLYQTAF
jgi:hypothetical protein